MNTIFKTPTLFVVLITILLSACVTQQYENNNPTPLVHKDANNNDMAMTRISLGLGYLKIGNTSQAKLNLERAKKHAPELPQVYSAFAHYYQQVNEVALAEASFEQALHFDGQNADTLNNFGVFLCKQQRLEEAERYMLKAIAVPSYLQVAKSYENLALCMLTANKFSLAENYLTKAISHSPSRASSLLLMAKLQYAKAQYLKALQYIQQYEKHSVRLSASALALAYKTNSKLKRHRIGQNYADMLVKVFPHSFEAKQYALNNLALIEADELALKFKEQQQAEVVTTNHLETNTAPAEPVVTAKASLPAATLAKDTKKTIVLSPEGVKRSRLLAASELPPKNIADNNKKTVAQQEVGIQTKSAPQPRKTDAMPMATVHVVKEGDNLFSISRKYNIRMTSLERWNKIKRNQLIKVGDKINLVKPK